MYPERPAPIASGAPPGNARSSAHRLDGLSRSERLLVALCRRERAESLPIPSGEEVDVETFQELSRLSMRHGVHGLVLARLDAGWMGDLFAPHRPAIDRTLTLLRRQAAFWDLEQDRVIQALHDDGLDPLALKGAALRRWVYTSPVERVMGDLDILVTRAEVAPVLETLSTLGYESEYPDAARSGFREHLYHDRVAHPNGFEVEVHWGLTRPDAPIHLDPEHFRRHARVLDEMHGPRLRVPSAEDMVLHTVSQSEQDAVRSLRRLVDLDRVVAAEEVDWNELSTEALRAGLAVPLSVTTRLAEWLLRTNAPDAWTRGRKIGTLPRKAISLSRPVERLLRPPARADVTERHLFRFWCLPGWPSRLGELAEVVSGRGDPLEWVWEEEGAPNPVRLRPLRGLLRLTKLVVLQFVHLGRGLGLAASSAPGPDDFWRSSAIAEPPDRR